MSRLAKAMPDAIMNIFHREGFTDPLIRACIRAGWIADDFIEFAAWYRQTRKLPKLPGASLTEGHHAEIRRVQASTARVSLQKAYDEEIRASDPTLRGVATRSGGGGGGPTKTGGGKGGGKGPQKPDPKKIPRKKRILRKRIQRRQTRKRLTLRSRIPRKRTQNRSQSRVVVKDQEPQPQASKINSRRGNKEVEVDQHQ